MAAREIQSTKTATEADVTQPSSSLRGELSAVEACEQSIAKIDDEPTLRAELEGCRLSHQRRAAILG
ncbi:MAG: hypothetical protein KBF21_17240 [Thermoanaerobaculia bacterium]|jgi:hypothetical protein|nr:hypothetical protein [Thermoanaerobaculia bacterium]MBP9825976.1 hypothetical protein [Thermoanaerobaculia bacterium]